MSHHQLLGFCDRLIRQKHQAERIFEEKKQELEQEIDRLRQELGRMTTSRNHFRAQSSKHKSLKAQQQDRAKQLDVLIAVEKDRNATLLAQFAETQRDNTAARNILQTRLDATTAELDALLTHEMEYRETMVMLNAVGHFMDTLRKHVLGETSISEGEAIFRRMTIRSLEALARFASSDEATEEQTARWREWYQVNSVHYEALAVALTASSRIRAPIAHDLTLPLPDGPVEPIAAMLDSLCTRVFSSKFFTEASREWFSGLGAVLRSSPRTLRESMQLAVREDYGLSGSPPIRFGSGREPEAPSLRVPPAGRSSRPGSRDGR